MTDGLREPRRMSAGVFFAPPICLWQRLPPLAHRARIGMSGLREQRTCPFRDTRRRGLMSFDPNKQLKLLRRQVYMSERVIFMGGAECLVGYSPFAGGLYFLAI
jgi:hypothetical protein